MSNKLTFETFVMRGVNVHGNRYIYIKSDFVNSQIKTGIICLVHGKFYQIPSCHINRNHGCPNCNGGVKDSKERFINKANKKHNFKFDYSKVDYINSHTKVKIICPIHGVFEQTPDSHLQGYGCYECGHVGHYNEKIFESLPEIKNIPAVFYIVKFKNANEEFFKFGITKNSISRRFRKDYYGYNVEIIEERRLSLYNAFLEEQKFKKLYESKQYIPVTNFPGKTECFK